MGDEGLPDPAQPVPFPVNHGAMVSAVSADHRYVCCGAQAGDHHSARADGGGRSNGIRSGVRPFLLARAAPAR